jgi:hypothetical protein
MEESNTNLNLLLISLAIFLFMVAGSLDYEDAQNSRSTYCGMVRDGSWPDYKKTFQSECTKGNDNEQ